MPTNPGKPKKFSFYLLVFAAVVLIGVLLLYAVSFIPQSMIEENLLRSATMMQEEGSYPTVSDHSPSATLDNWTDSIILMEAAGLNSGNFSYVFTNPFFGLDDLSTVDALYLYASGQEVQHGVYVRYWMGFRALVRLVLCVMDYYQFRRFIELGLLILLALASASIIKNVNMKAAFAFFISFILMRPSVICSTVQFSTCFFIAFFAMLAVPWVYRHSRYEKAFFMVLGMLTMYLDFYTSPLLTLGMPLVYLCLIKFKNKGAAEIKTALADSLIWLAGYGGMWIAKLALTGIFSSENGFADGFSAFSRRMGITRSDGLDAFYNPLLAIRKAIHAVYVDLTGAAIMLAAVLVLAAVLIVLQRKGRFSFRKMFSAPVFLVLAALPFIWFAAAAQPTAIHYWFQYRGIAVFFWALGAMLCLGFKDFSSASSVCEKPEA